MMTPVTLYRWSLIHKWSSLICTGFILLLCLTGLPLIFMHEIDHWLHADIQPRKLPVGTPDASLDRVLDAAKQRHPALAVQFLSRDAQEPEMWSVVVGSTLVDRDTTRTLIVDARTAEVLGEPKFDEGFMHVMLRLHVDLFAGLPGTLFLGFIGLLFLTAIVSGLVLYPLFMRKLSFGSVRSDRSARIRWLDMHNLLGIVTLVWAFTVGLTGVINTLGEPVIKLWQSDQMADMLAPYKDKPAPTARASLQQSADAASGLEPNMRLGFIAMPGTDFSSQHHYTIFMRGKEPLTAKLIKPVLVDVTTARVADSRPMPWYVSTVLLSQPLHFGNYGGMPMKIIWALLDIATMIVLGSGLYLWIKRRQRSASERPSDQVEAGDGSVATRLGHSQ